MTRKSIACLLAATVLLNGCATMTTGRVIDQSQIAKIRKGKTTKQQVLAFFGSPDSTQIDDNGNEVLGYSFMKSGAKINPAVFIPIIGLFFLLSSAKTETQSQTLTVTLANNVVVSYRYAESGAKGSAGGIY